MMTLSPLGSIIFTLMIAWLTLGPLFWEMCLKTNGKSNQSGQRLKKKTYQEEHSGEDRGSTKACLGESLQLEGF